MRALIRLPLDLLLWSIYAAVTLLLLWPIGVVVCFTLARAGAYHTVFSPYFTDPDDPTHYRGILMWKPWWAWLWGNLEDGIDGAWEQTWRAKEFDSLWQRIFAWSAWRNPHNNLRFVPVINPVPQPSRVRYVGNSFDPHIDLTAYRAGDGDVHMPFWCYAWQGVFAGFWIIWPLTEERHFRLRIGWKVLPKDAIAGAVTGYRRFRYPFGVQFTPWRTG